MTVSVNELTRLALLLMVSSQSTMHRLLFSSNIIRLRADMTDFEKNEARRIIIVDDASMQRFIFVVEEMQEHVTLMEFGDAFNYIGKRCRILGGKLAGMEGVLRRVQNHARMPPSLETKNIRHCLLRQVSNSS